MTAKQYLRQLSRLRRHIEKLTEELTERRTRLEGTTMPLGEKVQSSPTGDRFADMIAALADKDRTRTELIFAYEVQRDQIVDQILGLGVDIYEDLLFRRYVQEQTLEQIAVAMHYSYDRVRHLHGEALQFFTRKYLDTQ